MQTLKVFGLMTALTVTAGTLAATSALALGGALRALLITLLRLAPFLLSLLAFALVGRRLRTGSAAHAGDRYRSRSLLS